MWKSFVNLILSGALLGMATGVAAEEGVPPSSSSTSMEWQMMPGESFYSLSRLFYPKSSAMQRLFVKSALILNREQMPDLTGDFKFANETTVQIPTVFELSRHAPRTPRHRSHPVAASSFAEQQPATLEPEKLAPTGLGKEQNTSLQSLEQYVDQRQQELEALNARLKLLEKQSQTLQDSIKANTRPLEEARSRQLKQSE